MSHCIKQRVGSLQGGRFGDKTMQYFLQNLHDKKVKFPVEGNALFVLVIRKGCRDVS